METRRFLGRLWFALWLLGAMCTALNQAHAGTYVLTINVPIEVCLSIGASSDEIHVFMKARGGKWQQADYELRDGRIRVWPDPKKLGGNEILLIINPPADLDIFDERPPILLGIKADGKPLPSVSDLSLGQTLTPPRVVTWGVADRENALDLGSLRVVLDGELIKDERISVTPVSARQVAVCLDLQNLQYGEHEIEVTIADAFPQSNELHLRASVDKVAGTNYVRTASGEVEVTVDSHYETYYPSVAPLTDGFSQLTGEGAGNDVTWASAENDQPHWIEIKLPEPKPIKEVTVYWAYSGSTFYTSQNIHIQVPDDGGWRTVYTPPGGGFGPQRNTSFFFGEVTTDRFRVYQPPNGGPAPRPGLMWAAEVEAR